MIKKSVKWIYYLEWMFQLLFFIYTVLSFNSLTYGTKVISVVMWPTFALGAGLFVYRLFHFNQFAHTPGLWMLAGLFIVTGITTVLHYEFDFKRNVLFMIYWLFYFFILYCQKRDDPQIAKRNMRIFGTIFCVYMALGVLISLILFIAGISKTTQIPGQNFTVITGFVYGRLWGAFIDPNAGAVSSVLTIVLSIYFIMTVKSKLVKAAHGFNIVLQMAYIMLSDSRTGMVCLGVGLFMVLFLLLYYRALKTNWGKKALALVVAGIIGLTSSYSIRVIQNVYNAVISHMSEVEEPPDPAIETPIKNDYMVERGYDLDSDVSNRRFFVWKSGLEIWIKRPVLGVSFSGMLPFAEKRLPETYIVNNDYAKIKTMDNEPLNLLVSTGVLGTGFYLAFAVYILVFILRRLKHVALEYQKEIVFGFAAVTLLATASLFRATMFFHNSPNANFFWMILGYVMVLCSTVHLDKAKGKEITHE